MKQTKKTKITLLSWTQNPLETIYAEWVQSRTTGPVPLPDQLAGSMDHEYSAKILEVFEKVIAMKMPLGETIDFVFLIEHCSVALREQLVRHRIGHKFGDRLGADIIPDLAGTSSFWSQTTRIIDMGTFATDGDYLTPNWLEENGDKPIEGLVTEEMDAAGHSFHRRTMNVGEFYHDQMKWIQTAYRRLIKAGMPMEDARNILPVAMQHRLTWKCNLSSIMHVLSRRSCFTGDTKVSMLDGTEKSFKELAESKQIHDFYGCTDEGQIIPVKGTVTKTGNNQPLVAVKLDNGQVIRCTPDHKFMTRDGRYVEAQHLKPYQSLMPLYRKIYDDHGTLRETVWHNHTGKKQHTHRMVAGNIEGKVIHHDDENALNNKPSNLIHCTHGEHLNFHHQKHILGGLASSTPENIKKRCDAARIAVQNDPNWGKHLVELSQSEEGRKAISERTTLQWQDPEIRKKMSDSISKSKTIWNKVVRTCCMCLKEFVVRENRPNRTCGTECRNRMINKERYAPNNHKVISVTHLEETDDVYCAHIDHPTHRFALSAGVFVSNCWLAQLGMWEPVITGIVEELATKIHPTFRRLIDPPCCDEKGDFKACDFGKENEEVINNGNYPPCSLWVNKEHPTEITNSNRQLLPVEQILVSDAQLPRYRKMQEKYSKLWRRDPKTGERLALT